MVDIASVAAVDQDRKTSPDAARVAALESAVRQAEHKICNLQTALQTSREIGMAVGIIMARRYLTADQAFDLLVRVSQLKHIKVREIANDVVYTGKLDGI